MRDGGFTIIRDGCMRVNLGGVRSRVKSPLARAVTIRGSYDTMGEVIRFLARAGARPVAPSGVERHVARAGRVTPSAPSPNTLSPL
jgi:hypothetical protein